MSMAYFCRSIAGVNSLILSSSCRSQLTQWRPIVMKVSAAPPPSTETPEQRNLRLKRPMSPHLLIYKPQLTSMLSITHRMTGLALAAYAMGFAALSLSPGTFPHAVEAIQSMHLPVAVVFTGKLLLSFSPAYHLCNGVRHLVWDMGKALTIKEVYTTGYVLCAVSTVLALVLAAK